MEKDLPNPELIASARQIMDVPPEDDMHDEDGPLYIAWFALGHAAVLLYLAVDDLVELAAVEPDAAAFRTIVDFDRLALTHHQIDLAGGAQHPGGHLTSHLFDRNLARPLEMGTPAPARKTL